MTPSCLQLAGENVMHRAVKEGKSHHAARLISWLQRTLGDALSADEVIYSHTLTVFSLAAICLVLSSRISAGDSAMAQRHG